MLRKLIPLVLLVGTLGLVGCGSGASGDKPTSMANESQVDNMVAARKIFDGSDKNWESLPQDKKDEFTKLVGGKPGDATRWWDQMLNPPGASGGSPTSGPK